MANRCDDAIAARGRTWNLRDTVGHETRWEEKRCSHGKEKSNCAECNPCPHGKVKSRCAECNGCPHGKLKDSCSECNPCPHGKLKSNCAECTPALTAAETQLRGVQPLPSRQAEKELREVQERLETLLRGRPTGLEETHGMKQAERVANTLGVTCALEFMYSITIHQTRTSRNSGECESSVAMRSIQSKSPLPGSLRVLR